MAPACFRIMHKAKYAGSTPNPTYKGLLQSRHQNHSRRTPLPDKLNSRSPPPPSPLQRTYAKNRLERPENPHRQIRKFAFFPTSRFPMHSTRPCPHATVSFSHFPTMRNVPCCYISSPPQQDKSDIACCENADSRIQYSVPVSIKYYKSLFFLQTLCNAQTASVASRSIVKKIA